MHNPRQSHATRARTAGRTRSRALSFAATAAATLLCLGAATGPALADSPPETDYLWITAPSDLTLPTADPDTGDAVSNTIDIVLNHDNTHNSVSGGTLTIDASDLTDVAEVTWPSACTPTSDTAASCPFGSLDGSPWTSVAKIDIRAKAGAPDDATGALHYSATADSSFGTLTSYPTDTQIQLGNGPDLGVNQLPFLKDVQPGTDLSQPIRLSNHGNEAADRTILTLFASHGLSLTNRFSNCTYLNADRVTNPTGTTAVCVLDEPIEPGQSYDLSAAGAVTATDAALYERFDYSVDPYSDEAYQQALAGRPFVQGTGPELDAAPVASARTFAAQSQDLNSADNYRMTQITATNTADFVAQADDITGAAPGDTVTARVGVKNQGPAWVASLAAGANVAPLDVRLPEGTTAVSVPDMCYVRGANLYRCYTPVFLWEKDSLTFDFKLRVDSIVDGAKGSVATVNDNTDLPIEDFDPNLSNNATEFTLAG
ncbi:hypothetical protein [Streptomyces sp. NPDC046805]|uniref:hypothetical protein n=1 Tax=Streptomyces sp. NPDC046805 TaxID=3155134 RepID=UPI0033C2E689